MLPDARLNGDGEREQEKQEDGGDAGNRGEFASGERHDAGNATIEPSRAVRLKPDTTTAQPDITTAQPDTATSGLASLAGVGRLRGTRR
ncbi:MAG TPA: hypothetical protein VFS23_40040, partial [Vicinamibacterales bacterium]|nr:hypothetical protein [Vicinamibacterales bacterium]